MTVLLVESLRNPVVVQSRNLEAKEQENLGKPAVFRPYLKAEKAGFQMSAKDGSSSVKVNIREDSFKTKG